MENKLQIWSDGAINVHDKKKPGGWAYVYVYDKMLMCTHWRGVLDTTSQRMELTGALQGLLGFLEGRHKDIKDLKIDTIEVVSDSAYLINCFNQSWWVSWKYMNWKTSTTGEDVKNRDLWEQLIEASMEIQKLNIKIIWKKVKGHCGILYNEVVDKLAVKAKLSVS